MFWIVMVVALALDQVSKYFVVNALEVGESIIVIPDFFHITYVLNTGASFSLFQGQRIVFLIITIAVLIAAFALLPKIPKDMKLFRFLMALFCGGTIGNLIDRAFNGGAVIDFINVPWFAVFNVADCFIVVPAILICLMLIFGKAGKLLETKKEKVENE